MSCKDYFLWNCKEYNTTNYCQFVIQFISILQYWALFALIKLYRIKVSDKRGQHCHVRYCFINNFQPVWIILQTTFLLFLLNVFTFLFFSQNRVFDDLLFLWWTFSRLQKFRKTVTVHYKKLIRRWDTEMWHCSVLLPLLCLTPPTEGFPRDDLHKILGRGRRMAEVQNGEKVLPKVSTTWVGRKNVTDDRRICDSKDANVT